MTNNKYERIPPCKPCFTMITKQSTRDCNGFKKKFKFSIRHFFEFWFKK